MVKSPTENSVLVLKGAALIELKIGDLPIVFGGLISQAVLPRRPLISHSFNQGAQNFCFLHMNTKPMYPSSDTLQFQFGFPQHCAAAFNSSTQECKLKKSLKRASFV